MIDDPRSAFAGAPPVAALAIGLAILAIASSSTFDAPTSRPLAAIGLVYVVSGILLGVLVPRAVPIEVSFRNALAIALVGGSIVVFLHWRYRHGLGWLHSPWSISFWAQLILSSHVTVPTVTALFLPLGFARSSRQFRAAVALLAVPFLIGTVVGAIIPIEFGFGFVLALLAIFYLAGTIFGSVLYVTGRSLRSDVE